MINDIRQAVINKLIEVYPAITERWLDTALQDFTPPAFQLNVTGHSYTKRLSNKYNAILSMELAYFSDADNQSKISDCLEKQETLLRALDFVGTYKVNNKNAQITDAVLHITFDVSYSEMKQDTAILMQTQTNNMEL